MRALQTHPQRPRRVGVAEAKSRLSEVLREAAQGPTIIHSRGKDVAIVLGIEDYERLTTQQTSRMNGGAEFLQRVDALKRKHGSGVSFDPPRLEFVPAEPFSPKGARKGLKGR